MSEVMGVNEAIVFCRKLATESGVHDDGWNVACIDGGGDGMIDAYLYADTVVTIHAAKKTLGLRVELKENHNPVVYVTDDGNMIRCHGEFYTVRQHLMTLVTASPPAVASAEAGQDDLPLVASDMLSPIGYDVAMLNAALMAYPVGHPIFEHLRSIEQAYDQQAAEIASLRNELETERQAKLNESHARQQYLNDNNVLTQEIASLRAQVAQLTDALAVARSILVPMSETFVRFTEQDKYLDFIEYIDAQLDSDGLLANYRAAHKALDAGKGEG